MSDFASAGGTESFCFARAIAGEVILVHISFGCFFVQTFKLLRFAEHTQGAGCKRLGLSSGEDSRAVYAGKNALFAPDGAYVFETPAVGTDTFIENLCAYFFFGEIVKAVLYLALVVGINFGKVFQNFLFSLILSLLSFLSVESIDSPVDFFACVSAHFFIEFFGNVIKFDFELRLADFGNDFFFDKFTDFFDFFVTVHYRADHLLVGYFVRTRFNHKNCVLSSRKVEMNRALFALCKVGVDNVLSVYHTNNYRAGGTCPRNIGNCKRDGRAYHCKGFGRDIGFNRKSLSRYHYVVKKTLGEKRTKGSVD